MSSLERDRAEQRGDLREFFAGGGFVEADAELGVVDRAQVDARGGGCGVHGGGVDVADMQRVEEALADMRAGLAQRAGEDRGEAMHAAGDADEAVGAVVDGVHRRHHRQQHLRGADIGGGLLAADVLLAGLQREAIGGLAFGVDRDADQAAGHRALVGVAAGHERGMRAAEAERHAEALRVADDDVRAPFAGRGDQGQREQVGGDGDEAAAGVHGVGQRLVVMDRAERVRVLQQHAVAVDAGGVLVVADVQFDVEAVGAGAQHLERLRMHAAGDEEHVRLRLGRTLGQRHRLGGGSAFVEQRGIGDVHAGEVGAQGLEVDQRFHAALRDLRLVRGVRRVPRGILEDVAQDDVGGVGAVVALADEAAEHLVPVGDRADLGQRLDFGDRARQRQRCGRLDRRRDDRIGHRVQRVVADHAQHLRDLGVVGADVALEEGGVVFELAKRCGVLGHDRGVRGYEAGRACRT